MIILHHFLDYVESVIYECVITEARVPVIGVSIRDLVTLLNFGHVKSPQTVPETGHVMNFLRIFILYFSSKIHAIFTDAQFLFFEQGEEVGAGGGAGL